MDTGNVEINITEQDLEWMRFQQEMSKQICTIFGISAQMLGVPDDRVVDGTIQPVPLALSPVTETS